MNNVEKETKESLMLGMLKTVKSIEDRASEYLISIKKQVEKNIIDVLLDKKDKLTDELYDLKDFNLDTNHNKGRVAMTREECAERMEKIIQKEFELGLLELEINSKQKSFEKYFC